MYEPTTIVNEYDSLKYTTYCMFAMIKICFYTFISCKFILKSDRLIKKAEPATILSFFAFLKDSVLPYSIACFKEKINVPGFRWHILCRFCKIFEHQPQLTSRGPISIAV
jgi:hypothetical protein